MNLPSRLLPPGLLLACVLLAACGQAPAPADDAGETPRTVDPALLEAADDAADDSATDPVPRAADWTPALPRVAAKDVNAVLRAADEAREEGRLLSAIAPAYVAPDAGPDGVAAGEDAADAAGDTDPDATEPAIDDADAGALERYLAVLATDPANERALAGVEGVSGDLVARGREALVDGRIAEAQRFERVVSRASPQHPELATFRTQVDAGVRAFALTRRADRRAAAGRLLEPGERSAVAAYRDALAAVPGFVPAEDGLRRAQAGLLDAALAAAQAGDYPRSEKLQADAGRVLADSPAWQDMAARLVELRQARTDELLAQGNAAVDALDLELAARRLDEAKRVSVQARGLDALAQRIELATHYGRFRPGQVFAEPLASGGNAPELVVLAHGSFEMGSPGGEPQRQDNEGPRHAVAFARGVAMARNETTVAEFRAFVDATGYRTVATRRGRSTVYDERGGAMVEHSGVDWRRDHAGLPAGDTLPVVHVAFEDAEAYAAWLSAQTGQRYRLPSEAEFEYALRGGRAEAWPWGDAAPARVVGNLTGDGDVSRMKRRWSNAIAGYSDGHWGPAPVRTYPAEAFGTFDLVGNVSEWVQDCWHDSYRRAPVDGSAWVNPGCEERVVRGASWASTLDRARSAYRQASPAGTTHARLGFRVVREI